MKVYGVIHGISPNLIILHISVISYDKRKYQRKRVLVWKGRMWRWGKMLSQGHLFREFKVVEVFLYGTTYFYHNSIIAHEKTNSTMCFKQKSAMLFFGLFLHIESLSVVPRF
jgi:hypothetical protein